MSLTVRQILEYCNLTSILPTNTLQWYYNSELICGAEKSITQFETIRYNTEAK